jgi:hypothetical protein
MSEAADILARKSLMIVFAYAPAGLGHLRVTDALYHGLPTEADPILLRSQDASTGYLHHLTSIHPILRAFFEWMQSGTPEELFTRFYRRFLRSSTKGLYGDMVRLFDERFETPDTVLVVATHFGLAHQLAAIKEKLSREKNVRVFLVLQVTDDSPQRIWYVAGADLIAVPSERTKAALMEYGKAAGLPPVQFEVLAYPVNPHLNIPLTADEYEQRIQQVAPQAHAEVQVVIPVSGAAVGLSFSRQFIDALHRKSARFRFHVVAKSSPYTQSFLHEMEACSFVTLHTAKTDRETVEKYEQLYQNTVVALEVTKPSEQAFKALINPHRRGGILLLFSQPVGRQEYDNLRFLDRHRLLPTTDEQEQLWRVAARNGSMKTETSSLFTQALMWRGIKLPDDPLAAADYVWWSLQQGLFTQMFRYILMPQPDDPAPREMMPDGVSEFWKTVSTLPLQPSPELDFGSVGE